jgi:hypothetical protein
MGDLRTPMLVPLYEIILDRNNIFVNVILDMIWMTCFGFLVKLNHHLHGQSDMPQTLDVKYLSPTKNVKGVLALGRSN